MVTCLSIVILPCRCSEPTIVFLAVLRVLSLEMEVEFVTVDVGFPRAFIRADMRAISGKAWYC
jgi:hypothetical protein